VIDQVLFDWAALAVAAVVGAFFADYLLTHAGARASQRVRDRWSVEGSYELNPTWERQIDSGQLVSVRVFIVPALLAVVLALARLIAWPRSEFTDPAFFGFAVGSIALLQAPILLIHGTNLQTFTDLAVPSAAQGGVRYSRWFAYRSTAGHLARFGVLWIVLWVPSQQAFFLGGALSCLVFARRLAQLGQTARRTADTTSARVGPPDAAAVSKPPAPEAAGSPNDSVTESQH
jgi:hypothetical protein